MEIARWYLRAVYLELKQVYLERCTWSSNRA